jgi:predicted DNA-binding protein with PD1-like motif
MRSTALSSAVLASVFLSRATHSPSGPPAPVARWLKPSETAPHGRVPGARVRLLSTQSDGTKTYVLVLSEGDQVQAAIAAFASDNHVVDAHFSAIGAVRDPEVAWFDESRKEYKAVSLREQMEALTLSGDITLGIDGRPIVHTHVVLGRSDGGGLGRASHRSHDLPDHRALRDDLPGAAAQATRPRDGPSADRSVVRAVTESRACGELRILQGGSCGKRTGASRSRGCACCRPGLFGHGPCERAEHDTQQTTTRES